MKLAPKNQRVSDMVRYLLILIFSAISAGKMGKYEKNKKPNIIFVLADDIGWNEVSWHNKNIKTPFMERLSSSNGIRLEQSYVAPKCSPSRAAFMTGYYPFRLGMQRQAIRRFEPVGLNTSYQTLPQILQSGGYSTHMVGKWHLGHCKQEYLPNNRGFQSFFGQYTHKTHYYTRKHSYTRGNTSSEGYDLYDNYEVTYEGEGEFSTDLFSRKAASVILRQPKDSPLFLYVAYQAPHHPFQGQEPPQKYMKQYTNSGVFQKHLTLDKNAVPRAAAITAIDSGMRKIVEALKKSGLYKNSIIVFSSDNGGACQSCSFPLRGGKAQLYEGGVRAVGFIHSPLIKKPKKQKRSSFMYITDWMSTLLNVAELGHLVPQDVDSFNMWPVLVKGKRSPRKEVVLNLDQDPMAGTWSAVIRMKNYKFIQGQDTLLFEEKPEESCNQQLYNLEEDPYEKINLMSNQDTKMAKQAGLMRTRLMEHYRKMVLPPTFIHSEKAADPGNFGGNIATGWC